VRYHDLLFVDCLDLMYKSFKMFASDLCKRDMASDKEFEDFDMYYGRCNLLTWGLLQ
jgi:hypothetical protein